MLTAATRGLRWRDGNRSNSTPHTPSPSPARAPLSLSWPPPPAVLLPPPASPPGTCQGYRPAVSTGCRKPTWRMSVPQRICATTSARIPHPMPTARVEASIGGLRSASTCDTQLLCSTASHGSTASASANLDSGGGAWAQRGRGAEGQTGIGVEGQGRGGRGTVGEEEQRGRGAKAEEDQRGERVQKR